MRDRMGRVFVVPQEDADLWASEAASRSRWADYRPQLEPLGLFTWIPDPWESAVGDTSRPYFFWVYLLEWDPDSDFACWDAPMVFVVGNSPKGGHPFFSSPKGDVEIDTFENLAEAMYGMEPTTERDLKAVGLSDVQVLSLLGTL